MQLSAGALHQGGKTCPRRAGRSEPLDQPRTSGSDAHALYPNLTMTASLSHSVVHESFCHTGRSVLSCPFHRMGTQSFKKATC